MEKGQEGKLKATAEALKKLELKEFQYHKKPVEEVVKELNTNLKTGLSQQEAAARLDQHGPNQLEKEEEESLFEKIKEQFEDLLVRILLLAAIVSFIIAITGDGEEGLTAYVEPFVILTILVVNAVISIWQDSNADKALEALKKMQAVKCRLLRNGEWSEQDSVNLVPGDIVEVRVGDRVPADLRIAQLTSVSLQVEEAPLTGESVSVQKTTKPMSAEAQLLQDQKNMLFSSTVINYGSAVGVVVYTGMNTAIGRVQQEVAGAAEEEEDTPLKKKLDSFGELLSKIIAIICFLVWAMNFNNFFDPTHGTPIKGCIYYFKIAIALAVAAIPEGLPAVITTCLALGTRKMAQNNAIVRRLPSVETLGCTTVICSDKTGTLTKNQMCAVKFAHIGSGVSDLKIYNIQEKSYDPQAQIQGMTADTFAKVEAIRQMGVVCALNNNSSIVFEDGKFDKIGEPTEAALKVFAEKLGQYDKILGQVDFKRDPTAYSKMLSQKIKKIADLDFTSERKTMSTVVRGLESSGNTLLLKGAPERVIQKSKSFKLENGETREFTQADKDRLVEQILQQAKEGLRVLGVAILPGAGELKDLNEQNIEQKLSDTNKYSQFETGATFLGFVCIKDPVREEVKQAIQECKTAGIRVIMITGDSKETAVAIAKEIHIIEGDAQNTSFTGSEFEGLSHDQKLKALGGAGGKVFSRVEPRHKRELVKLLIEMNQIVAMTGDGVNDAPALKQAHIGIAMGITGTEVAKEASDMVLADDNFATIVKAVEEGRAIYSNMKAFIRYLISSNIGEVASIFLTAMLGIPEGFSSVQLLWVNLVTDGPPATALGFNPPDKDIMKQRPRSADDQLISGWVFFRYMVIGVYVGAATVGIFIYWYTMADNTGDGHTLVTWAQLSNWSECPSWPEGSLKVSPFAGMDFSKNPCEYFTKGKVKASTLSLSVLVVIEMLNALNALSEDNSLLVIPPWVNPYLLLAIVASIGSHMFILSVPLMNQIFGIMPLNQEEWILVLAFSAPVILVDEVLKFFGRIKNAAELRARLNQVEDEKKGK